MGGAGSPSSDLHRCLNGRKQSRVGERFQQKTRGTLLLHPNSKSFVPLACDKYDRNLEPAAFQIQVKVGPTNSRHRNVEN